MRKHELMYKLFGKSPDGKCKDCKYYKSYKYRDHRYRKCEIYGISNSEATDWKGSGDACGLFPDKETKVRDAYKIREKKPKPQVEGQMDFGDYLGMVKNQFDNMTGSMNL